MNQISQSDTSLGTVIHTKTQTPSAFKNALYIVSESGDPYGIRTRVAAVKGQCPRPLDEGVAMNVVLQEARKESKRDNVR